MNMGPDQSSKGFKPKPQLKVAICHEWLDNVGGGEKVLAEMALNFYKPTIFTLWGDFDIARELNIEIEETILRFLPRRLRRNIGFLLMPIAWLFLSRRLKRFDLVITSSWAFAHFCGRFNIKSIKF